VIGLAGPVLLTPGEGDEKRTKSVSGAGRYLIHELHVFAGRSP